MVGMYTHATFNLNPRPRPSTRRCMPFCRASTWTTCIPNAIISIAASKRCQELTKEIFGGEMEYVPWMRPGFELGLAMQEIARQQPEGEGHHDGPAWLHRLGTTTRRNATSRRSTFIENAAAYIEEKYAAKGGDAKAFGGAEVRDACPAGTQRTIRRDPPLAPRPASANTAASSARSRTTTRSCAS